MSDNAQKLGELEQEYTERRQRILDAALTEEQRKDLATVDLTLRDLQARKNKQTAAVTLSLSDVTTDENVAKAFRALTPGETARLYEENRTEWQRGLDAVERVGTRRMLGGY